MSTTPNPAPMASVPPPVPPKPEPLRPTVLGAWRAIWLFTWRPQFGWRRLPTHLLGLLLLPVLVYLTLPVLRGGHPERTPLIRPDQQVNEIARRLARAGLPLQPQQREQLLKIFREESAALSATEFPTGENAVARQKGAVHAAFDRITSRAQEVLDDRQLPPFRTFTQRSVLVAEGQIRPSWHPGEPFYHWLLDLYFFVVLPLQCVRGSGGLIRDEVQADTLGFLLTRPLSRARLLALKYAAQTAWLELSLLAETLLIFAAGALRQQPNLLELLPLFLGAQVLAVLAWSALGVFLGQLTKRYMALALVYGLIVEMGIGRIPTNINTLSLMRHLKTLLAHNSAVQNVYEWSGLGVPTSLAALILAPLLFVGLAALLFTIHEYHHTTEMEK
ncbi:MAG TPA: ABC transporter permease subunit [Verrucomicrobiae bacterium]|nr:ABC transporter permease subunit [Verrucomicrobiae bacterium]